MCILINSSMHGIILALRHHVNIININYYILGGACGFGGIGRTLNNGSVAAVSGLFRNGAGCGACYQVRTFLMSFT